MADAQTREQAGERIDAPTKCIIFPLPKVVFFYPTMLAAFLCSAFSTDLEDGVMARTAAYTYLNHQTVDNMKTKEKLPLVGEKREGETETLTEPIWERENAQAWQTVLDRIEATERKSGALPAWFWGWVFLTVFSLNVLVISFDFPGVKALMFAFMIVALVLGALLINYEHPDFLPGFVNALALITPYASNKFYLSLGIVLLAIISVSTFINRYWNKWIVESNRLVHKHGMLGDVKEWPTLNLQIRKEINDVFEWGLLMSGTLIFMTGNPNERPIVLENVPWINRKEKQIRRILEAWRVGDE